MKKFYEFIKKPLVIALIAGVLYLIDALIAGLFVKGASFMWVAFVFWTVFFGASVQERIRGFIGMILGFLSAVVMMLITASFSLNIYTISISCLLGVLLVNFLVMFLERTEKTWTNSVTGAFVGIFLTFSNLGCGLNPLNGIKEAGIMIAIMAVYGVLGLLCGFFSIFFTKKKKQNVTQNEDKE